MAVTVNSSGLMTSSGFDVQALVDQMIQAAQAPEQVWKSQQTTLTLQATALKSLASKLASLNTSVETLNDVLGPFAQRTATSSDDALVSATASTAASLGQHVVTVTSLATKAVYYSNNQVATGDSALSGGTMTLSIGSNSQQIAIGNDTNSLNKLATKINGLAMGITASVITDATGAKLALVANATGKANDISLTTTSDSALAFTKASDGANSVATVDGVPVSSSTNELANVITGLTLQLNGQAPNTPVSINVGSDTGRVSQAITDFVNNYNSLTTAINSQFTYDQSSGKSGVLAGDSSVRTLQQQLMQAVGAVKVSSSQTPTLRSLGITMNDDGTLAIDSVTLNSALTSKFNAVQTFFQDRTNGFATNLGILMNSLTDSVNGPFVVELKGNADNQTALTNTINDFEDRLTLKRQQLVEQFSQVEAALQALPTMQNEIDAMMGTLSSSTKK